MSAASPARVAANIANAQFSTGPKTDAGKAASSQNARTHGLASKQNVIQIGQEQEFAELVASLEQDFHPQGAFQNILFQTIVNAAWTLRRCQYAEVALQADPRNADPLLADTNEANLRRIHLYAGRAERSLYRAVKELRTMQSEALYRAQTSPKAAASAAEPDSPLADTRKVDADLRANASATRTKRKAQERDYTADLEAYFNAPMPSAAHPEPEPPTLPGFDEQTKPGFGLALRSLLRRAA